MFKEAERVGGVHSRMDPYYRKMIDDEDKEIIKNVGKPLPPGQFDTNPHMIEMYKRHRARTCKQKIAALERELGGRNDVHCKGMWREPKWKQRQIKQRVLEYSYLIERGYAQPNYC